MNIRDEALETAFWIMSDLTTEDRLDLTMERHEEVEKRISDSLVVFARRTIMAEKLDIYWKMQQLVVWAEGTGRDSAEIISAIRLLMEEVAKPCP